MSKRTITRTAATWAVLATALVGCATQGPTTQGWRPVPVGSSWGSVQRNTGSYGRDAQVTLTRMPDRDWNGAPALVIRTNTGGMLLQHPSDGRWLALLAPDGRATATFDPPAGWTQPLVLGSSWKRQQKMTNPMSGRTFEYEWACSVPAAEKVSVPAGTFDALRVECTSTLDARETYWVTPTVNPFLKTRLERGPKHPAGPGTQETELLKLPS